MWTGLILACSLADPNLCVAASSQQAYESEEDCEASFAEGVAFITQTYPGMVIVEGPLCYRWEYFVPNV